jgi:hypothetical protein
MKYKADTPGQVVPAPSENREYLHTTGAGVVVPFLQTMVTGILVFMGAWLLGWLVFDLLDPIKPAIVLMVLATVGVWLWRLSQWANLARMEKLTGLDLNRDGVVGNKNGDVVQLKWSRLNQGQNGPSYQSGEMNLPVSREQLITLAEGLTSGLVFSENTWCGPGKVFSINEFRGLRTVMYKRGLIELANEKDVRQGYQLTEDGWEVMEHIVEEFGGIDAEDPEDTQEG